VNINHCFQGDCRAVMRELIATGYAGNVQTIVTSPPYWGLRDYGVDGQLGQEATLSEFIANMVEVFELCRELLAEDGTMWLNMGDSYASRGGLTPQSGKLFKGRARQRESICLSNRVAGVEGLKSKDLCGQPWRLAFALQDAGWYLRQDIIWHKPNPMPESVRDRCTKAHEYVFLLSKSERYFIDPEGMKEPAVSTEGSGNKERKQRPNADILQRGAQAGSIPWSPRSKRDSFKREDSKRAVVIPGQSVGTHRPDRPESDYDVDKRNRRSVWTIATEAFKGAHFAVMPEALVEPCILAGSRPGDLVFDPFMGSGTVAQVAQNLGRKWIGTELNPEYIKLQHKRTQQLGLELPMVAA
jgi:DNA modification methylase